MSWAKRHIRDGRWRGDLGDPGRPARPLRMTEQVRPEDNIEHYQEAPRMNGRISCGRTRDEAAEIMAARGDVERALRLRADKTAGTCEPRPCPSPQTGYVGKVPTMARDRNRDLDDE